VASPPERPRVAGIILAAGQSTRLGRPKQLLDICGKTTIRRVVEAALASGLDSVIVVLGSAADDIDREFADLEVQAVPNPEFASGQSTSMRAGLAALADDVDAALFLLGDQPTMSPGIIGAVLRAYRNTGATIVQARYRGETGHPVLFDRSIFNALNDVTGDRGARQVIARNPELVRFADIHQDAPLDIDTEADYERVLIQFHSAKM
jgi:molybdenum cofactor cytidylyltransferase